MQGVKKRVDSMTGHCSPGSPTHHLCRMEWETPSVIGVCKCECHKRVEKKIVPKVKAGMVPKTGARVLVPKK